MNSGQNRRIEACGGIAPALRGGAMSMVARLILCLGCGCGSDDSHAQQARALLARIATLDLQATASHRAGQIQRLRGLKLADQDLARVRDACVLAHAGLLAAESEQAAVRGKLDRAGDAGLREPELTVVAAALRQAGERLRDAQQALPECETRTRALLERYR